MLEPSIVLSKKNANITPYTVSSSQVSEYHVSRWSTTSFTFTELFLQEKSGTVHYALFKFTCTFKYLQSFNTHLKSADDQGNLSFTRTLHKLTTQCSHTIGDYKGVQLITSLTNEGFTIKHNSYM